jgi:hypothetical protein
VIQTGLRWCDRWRGRGCGGAAVTENSLVPKMLLVSSLQRDCIV